MVQCALHGACQDDTLLRTVAGTAAPSGPEQCTKIAGLDNLQFDSPNCDLVAFVATAWRAASPSESTDLSVRFWAILILFLPTPAF